MFLLFLEGLDVLDKLHKTGEGAFVVGTTFTCSGTLDLVEGGLTVEGAFSLFDSGLITGGGTAERHIATTDETCGCHGDMESWPRGTEAFLPPYYDKPAITTLRFSCFDGIDNSAGHICRHLLWQVGNPHALVVADGAFVRCDVAMQQLEQR